VAPQAVARPIRFEVTRCTGEFEGHSGSELSKEPGPDNVGWLTPKFCEWPQEITLTLQTRVALSYVQILSHEASIADKIELWAHDEQQFDSPAERSLGHFKLSNNEKTNFTMREMRTVQLGGTIASGLTLKILGYHININNLYSQAGIISIRVFGTMTPSGDVACPVLTNSPHNRQPGDLAVDATLDLVTQEQLKQLQLDKQDALLREDFDEAKRCKSEMERLLQVAQALRKLEGLKIQAIEAEDYDAAKQITAEIARLRECDEVRELEDRKKAAIEVEDYDAAKEITAQITRLRGLPQHSMMVQKNNSSMGNAHCIST